MYYGDLLQEVWELQKKVSEIYVYGAGLRGKEICHILTRNHVEVKGFVVTKLYQTRETLGLPIIEADAVLERKEAGIVIGLGDIYTAEVVQYLKGKNADFSRIVDGGKYISQDRGSKDLQDNPTLEVTTVMGCKVNCKYCPQKVLMSRYFEKDKKRKSRVSLDDFKVYLEHTPKNCDFMFAGMSEPYLNPDCTKMLQMACEAGRNVSLYTTLEGITDKDMEIILQLPFQFVGLHVADECSNAKITVDEKYYERVETLVNAKKSNGEPFINDISAQAAPLPRIMEIIKGKYEVLISLQDRAGNLEGTELASRDQELKNEKITCCFSGPKFNNHVVLPDGTLLLCNMDYGMKHVLGNLLEKPYDEIRKGAEMLRVLKGCNGEDVGELLCNKCLFAMVKK